MKLKNVNRVLLYLSLGALCLTLATGTLGSSTSDIQITYTNDDNGDRAKEVLTFVAAPTDPTLTANASPTSMSTLASAGQTQAWPVTITPSSRSGPYVVQWAYVSGYTFQITPMITNSMNATSYVISSTCPGPDLCDNIGVFSITVNDMAGGSYSINYNIEQKWITTKKLQ
jgi:hypothetical protein